MNLKLVLLNNSSYHDNYTFKSANTFYSVVVDTGKSDCISDNMDHIYIYYSFTHLKHP